MGSKKEEAFEQYYTKYYPQVYGYIYKKLSDAHTAEDLTMDVFYICWDKFDTFDPAKASFQTWLFVIVNNKLKNFYRDHKDEAELDDTLLYDSGQIDETMEAIHLQQMRDYLYDALQELNETQRMIVIYRYFKDMNATQISMKTGLTAGNIRIQLKRAMDKIRQYFMKNNIRWE